MGSKSQQTLREMAWKNFCEAKGWKRKWGKRGRFDLFVALDKESVGGPYPLSIDHSHLLGYKRGDEISDGWTIPERFAVIGVYLGRRLTYEGQTRTKMIFATPTQNEKYRIYVAHSGIINWFGGGDDEPSQQSGIRVNSLYVTDPRNTQEINKRFGEIFRELSSLAS